MAIAEELQRGLGSLGARVLLSFLTVCHRQDQFLTASISTSVSTDTQAWSSDVSAWRQCGRLVQEVWVLRSEEDADMDLIRCDLLLFLFNLCTLHPVLD